MKHGRGAHSAMSSWESTGRSAVVFAPNEESVSGVLQKIAGHPIEFAAGEVFNSFSKHVPIEFRAAFAGGGNQADRHTRIKCFGNQRGFAVTGDTFDANFFGVDVCIGVGFEIVDEPAGAPLPCAERAPFVWLRATP